MKKDSEMKTTPLDRNGFRWKMSIGWKSSMCMDEKILDLLFCKCGMPILWNLVLSLSNLVNEEQLGQIIGDSDWLVIPQI